MPFISRVSLLSDPIPIVHQSNVPMKQYYTSVLTLALLCLFVLYAPVKAGAQSCLCSNGDNPQTLVHTINKDLPAINDSFPFTFPQFNPGAGTLMCVKAEIIITSPLTMRLYNDDASPIDYTIKYTRTDKIVGPGFSSLQTSLTKNYGPYSLAANDYVFGGPDEITVGPDTVFKTKTVLGTTSNVAPYLGNGNVTFNYISTANTIVSGSSNYTLGVKSKNIITFKLTYSFCNTALLPANLRNFTASRKSSKAVNLQWTTENEEKSNNYEIQFSENGAAFKTAGSLPAHVTAAAASKYNYQHNLTAMGSEKIYYRVKQVTANNKISYSSIRSVYMNDDVKAYLQRLYPNPAQQYFILEWNIPVAQDIVVEIVNNIGQTVHKKPCHIGGDAMLKIQMPQKQAPGVYFVKVTEVLKQTSQLFKLVIQ
jgi:Secretion system C-terminal sorting domain